MTGTPTTDEIIWTLGFAQPAIKAEFGANACILATRVAVEVLSDYDRRVEPLAVHVEVYNQAHAQHLERGDDPEAIDADPDCWSGQLGFTGQPQEDGLTDMHVVAVVEGRTLLDLTLDQASAPEQGVVLTPGVFADLPGDFVGGGRIAYPAHGGASVVYEAHPEEKGYLAMPDWTDRERRAPFVNSTLARLS